MNLNTCLKALFSKFRSHYVYFFVIDQIKSPISLHYRKAKQKFMFGNHGLLKGKSFYVQTYYLVSQLWMKLSTE